MSDPTLMPAVDDQGLVHLTWVYRVKDKVSVSLCSSITNAVKVTHATDEVPMCLTCIDIETRFW